MFLKLFSNFSQKFINFFPQNSSKILEFLSYFLKICNMYWLVVSKISLFFKVFQIGITFSKSEIWNNFWEFRIFQSFPFHFQILYTKSDNKIHNHVVKKILYFNFHLHQCDPLQSNPQKQRCTCAYIVSMRGNMPSSPPQESPSAHVTVRPWSPILSPVGDYSWLLSV